MGILDRFTSIVKANINELLDKAEDPEKMVDQYLREMTESLAEVREATAGVMAEERRCKKLVDENLAEMEKYEELARKALAAGNEADARVFLAKKQELAGRTEGLTVAYEGAKANADKMRIAKRAKELGLDAIHDTVHEMAKDEARHGQGFQGLFNRFFKK